MQYNQPANFIQLESAIASRCGQLHRLQPKLGILVRGFHMDMRGFIPFVAEKERSVTAFSEYFRHDSRCARFKSRGQLPFL